MKCNKCGFENKESAVYCTKCGSKLEESQPKKQVINKKSNKSKYIIIGLVAIIIVLIAVSYFALTTNVQSSIDNNSNQTNASTDNTTLTPEKKSKSWKLIDTYSGSGSGFKTVELPEGKIKVKLSAYPIKNYDINHLYFNVPDIADGEINWGPSSPVETRSDSIKFTLSSPETATIDYYETVDWEVKIYKYQ